VAERVLQKLKMRYAVFIERDEFAVYHGIASYGFERFGDFNVAVTDDLAIAAK
jgi:hypothetical protein